MRGSKKFLIGAIVGVLLMVWGAYVLNNCKEGFGDLDLVTGPLQVVEAAKDAKFGIVVETPILMRKVEMYQYSVDREGEIEEGFFTTRQVKPTEFTNDKLSEGKKLEISRLMNMNPAFPEGLKSETFYGKVKIGDDAFLGKDFLFKFSYEYNGDFVKQLPHLRVGALADKPIVDNLAPLNDYTYATIGSEENKWKIGDLRVTWSAVNPQDFQETYTALGEIKDGVLDSKGILMFFYDREMSLEDVESKYSDDNYATAIGLIVVGIVVVLICGFMFMRQRKTFV